MGYPLARVQRSLSCKQKGSQNRTKARHRGANVHAKLADQRRDATHKLSTQLIHENQAIAAESLQIKNLLKNRKLAKAISDVGWHQITQQLAYKAEPYWRDFVQTNGIPARSAVFTVAICHITDKMPLNIRTWDCPACGTQGIDRGINAVRNTLQAGKAMLVGADKLRQYEKNTMGLTGD